jgi:hypothetical protein
MSDPIVQVVGNPIVSVYAYSGPPNGPAGGDLEGSFPNPLVNSIQGVVITGTPQSGNTLVASGPTAAAWGSGGGGGNVSSVFTRTGAVIAQNGDYNFTQISGTAAITQGGTGQASQQAAINALTGTQLAGRFLRSDGTNATLSPIQVGDVPTLNQNTTGTAAGLSTTLPIALGGTGQITQQAALDALAGAQTAGQFLRGNGTHVVLSAIQSGDLPSQPYQFSVYTYGAKGDGKVSNTGSTNGTATVSIGEAVLTSADIGKVVMVKNALQNQSTAGQTTSVGTITAVPSSTSFTATWNTTPTLTASGLQVLWATDDTSAFQQAINAANTYAQAHGLGEITIPSPTGLFFGIGGPLVHTDGTNAVYNSQLYIPINAERNNGVTLVFRGVGDGGQTRYWNTSYPAWAGSPLVSFGVFTSATNQSNSISALSGGFGGNPSVIGGGTGKNGYGVGTPTPVYSNTAAVFTDMSIMTTHSNSGWTYSAINAYGVARCHIRNFSYGTNGVIELYNGNNGDFTNVTLLSGGLSAGIVMPSNGNNASNYVNNVVCNGGYTYALLAMEHTVGNNVTLLYSWSGVCPVGNYGDGGSTGVVSALHASWFDQLCVEACTYHINVFGAGASGIGPIFHAVLDTEGTLQLRDNPNNGTGLAAAMGEIRFAGSSSTITATFPTGLRMIKEQILPGVNASPPALVANTSVMNNLWRPATVYLTGGANLTTIQVSNLASGSNTVAVSTVADFTAAGTITTPFPVRVGPGQWIKINTASGTTVPTAIWVLD